MRDGQRQLGRRVDFGTQNGLLVQVVLGRHVKASQGGRNLERIDHSSTLSISHILRSKAKLQVFVHALMDAGTECFEILPELRKISTIYLGTT